VIPTWNGYTIVEDDDEDEPAPGWQPSLAGTSDVKRDQIFENETMQDRDRIL